LKELKNIWENNVQDEGYETLEQFWIEYLETIPKAKENFLKFVKSLGKGSFLKELEVDFLQQYLAFQRRDPDQVLLMKDSVFLSDDAYENFIKTLHLEKEFPTRGRITNRRKEWNKLISSFLQVKNIIGINGVEINLKQVLKFIFLAAEDKKNEGTAIPKTVQMKLSLDGRMIGGKHSVVIGIIPLNLPGFKIHSVHSVFPLILYEGNENYDTLKKVTGDLIKDMEESM